MRLTSIARVFAPRLFLAVAMTLGSMAGGYLAMHQVATQMTTNVVPASAATPNPPTNPGGITAPGEFLYSLGLTTPLATAYGGNGSAAPYKRLTLAAGVATWTFPVAFPAAPVCTASEESTTGHYLKITAISATAVTVTSDVTSSNTDPADVSCGL